MDHHQDWRSNLGVIAQTAKTAQRTRTALVFWLLVGGFLLFEFLETAIFGWPLVREEPPRFDTYHLAETGFAAAITAMLVIMASIESRAARGTPRAGMGAWGWLATAAAACTALAAVALLIVDPLRFHALAQEDTFLEWLSALLLLAASLLFACDAVAALLQKRRSALPLAIMLAALAAAFFVLGMEEISWMQRLFGFATPEELSRVNWQGEFNLHNINTDLSETVYYVGAACFLIVLPALVEMAPAGLSKHPLASLLPSRTVAAISAPLSIFNYGHWNLLPIQLTFFLTIGVLAMFVDSALRRRAALEAYGLIALALVVAIGQLLVLGYGAGMADIPDATEYKELFIAIGFASYAFIASRKLKAVSGEVA